jgi:hypothetical protein
MESEPLLCMYCTSVLLCTEKRRLESRPGVYSMNKAGGRRKIFITTRAVAQHLLKPLFRVKFLYDYGLGVQKQGGRLRFVCNFRWNRLRGLRPPPPPVSNMQ